MRVILAGASGAVGRHLITQLDEAGHDVIGLTRRPGSLAGTPATEVIADVADRRATLTALHGITANAVIHHAVPQNRPAYRRSELRTANRMRIEGTSTLIAAARQAGAKRFVIASSVHGYGFADHGRGYITENASFGSMPGPDADAEQVALRSAEQQARAVGGVCLRFGLFYGTGTDAPVSARASGVLPWIHPQDAATATLLALTRGGKSVALNIVDNTPATWGEVQAAQVVGAGRPVRAPDWLLKVTEPCVYPLMTATNMRVSNERAKAKLRWRPRFGSYAEGLSAAT